MAIAAFPLMGVAILKRGLSRGSVFLSSHSLEWGFKGGVREFLFGSWVMGGVARPTRRHPLQKRFMRGLLEELLKQYPGFPLRDVRLVEVAEFEGFTLYLFDGKAAFFRVEGLLIPALSLLLDVGYDWLPQVYVDRGATRAMVRGADLMIPGIRRVSGDFSVGSIVVIVDEESGSPIAVGEALLDSRSLSESISGGGRGRAFRNVHHVGDRLWGAATLIR